MRTIFCTNALHIDTTNATSYSIDGKGILIPEITCNFEGQLRNTTTPDIGADEFDVTVGVAEDISTLPALFSLAQNYPNPFNPTTAINYQLKTNCQVLIAVYDLLGREMATLVNEKKDAGHYSVQWDATARSSGIYFYILNAGAFTETKRMILLK